MGWRAKYALTAPVPVPNLRRRADKENATTSNSARFAVPKSTPAPAKEISSSFPPAPAPSTKKISSSFADLHVEERDIEFEADKALEDSEVDDFSPPPPPVPRPAVSLMQRFGRAR